MTSTLTKTALAALKVLVDFGELHRVPARHRNEHATWQATGHRERFTGRTIGSLIGADLAVRDGDYLRPLPKAAKALRRPKASPRENLPAHLAAALGTVVRHRRLIWCLESKCWETPLPQGCALYRTVPAKAIRELARRLLVTVHPETFVDITPEGDATAFMQGVRA